MQDGTQGKERTPGGERVGKKAQVSCTGGERLKDARPVAGECPTVTKGEEGESNPLGLTIRVNSSPYWGGRRASGTLYH